MAFKCSYSPVNGLGFTLEGGAKEIFKQISEIDETFGVKACGKCGGEDLRYVTREVDGNCFYEMRCTAKGCGYRLAFSQGKDQRSIFPRLRYHKQHPLVKEKKVSIGDWIPSNGWEKFIPPPKDED